MKVKKRHGKKQEQLVIIFVQILVCIDVWFLFWLHIITCTNGTFTHLAVQIEHFDTLVLMLLCVTLLFNIEDEVIAESQMADLRKTEILITWVGHLRFSSNFIFDDDQYMTYPVDHVSLNNNRTTKYFQSISIIKFIEIHFSSIIFRP